MKINDLNKEELQEIISLYIDTKDDFTWMCSLEEFCEDFVRKCECCGKFVVVENGGDELPTLVNWKGDKYKACSNCIEESQEEYCNEDGVPDEDYDKYVDYKLEEAI